MRTEMAYKTAKISDETQKIFADYMLSKSIYDESEANNDYLCKAKRPLLMKRG